MVEACDRIDRDQALKQRLERLREASQGDVDHLFSLLRVEGRPRLPKGISAPTLGLVVAAARESETEVTAVDGGVTVTVLGAGERVHIVGYSERLLRRRRRRQLEPLRDHLQLVGRRRRPLVGARAVRARR